MFKIDKITKPSEVTGYTFQGAPIVIGRRRGRPPKTKAKPGWYPLDVKVRAACLYAVTGSLDEVTKLTDVPKNQLRVMMGEQWWVDTISQVRREENDQLTAKMTTFVEKSIDAMLERIENGDSVINLKTGETYRTPVRLRDLAIPVGVLIDKRNLLRGEATSRSETLGQEETLRKLGDKFEQFAKKLNIHKPIDIIDVEVIDGQANARLAQDGTPEQVKELPEVEEVTFSPQA